MRKDLAATALALAAVLAVAVGTAVGAKPVSAFELVVLGTGAVSPATAEPSYGGEITFAVSTNETDRPFVNVRCYQGDAFVYDGWHGFFESYVPEPNFVLASDYWSGGAADCTARLVEWTRNGRERTLATLAFHVGA